MLQHYIGTLGVCKDSLMSLSLGNVLLFWGLCCYLRLHSYNYSFSIVVFKKIFVSHFHLLKLENHFRKGVESVLELVTVGDYEEIRHLNRRIVSHLNPQ